MRIPHPIVALCALAVPLGAQSFPCEKYTLPNGMTVILRVDHSLPTVVINTWFRVGSKDEPPGRSGFAHLFEHLMFMGTERVPGSQFDVLMENGGGSNNASTTEDRTNYYSEGPASLLPTLLWLDADRLEDLGRTMTQEKLDRQRDIVRNEIRQNVENTPYGRARERIYRLMYPDDHPYHEAVYGTHQDLEAATVDNVKDFFATFYVPNNASLVVAGDFDPERTKPLIAELFGTLPRGGAVSRPTVPDATLPGIVRATMLDKVQSPALQMVWHAPAAFQDGDAELSLLAAVLSQGKTSRLYKRLVFDERIATDVSAFQDSLALGSMFTIDVTGTPGADLDRIERIVDEELARVRRDGVTADELAQRQASVELRRLARLQNLGAVADQLNQYEFAWGEPNAFARDLDRFRKAVPQRLQQVAVATLDPDRRVILRVLPEQPERRAGPRDQRPAAFATAAFAAPVPQSFALRNGMRVHLFARPELPLVSMQVLFRTGAALAEPSKAGLVQLTAELLGEGAGELDALAFADAMQALGASFAVGASQESAAATLTVLRRNLDRGVELLADALRRPRLTAADWERIKALHLDELRQQDDNPNVVAGRIAMRTLFAADNPYAWPLEGTVASVTALTLDDVQLQRQQLFAPRNAEILIAGDLDEAAARTLLERTLGDWAAADLAASRAPAPANLDPMPTTALRVVLVDRPEAVQTVVRFYGPGPHYDDPRRMQHLVLGTILGGSFTSRLNQNLRERHGYTYGARASYTLAGKTGWFSAGANVRSDVTGASIRELLAELRRIAGSDHGDVTDEEVGKACETIRTDTVQAFGSLAGVLGNAGDLLLHGRPFTATAGDMQALQHVSAGELNALGRAAVPLDRGLLVLVGDAAAIRAQLQDLGLPEPVQLDLQGRPIQH